MRSSCILHDQEVFFGAVEELVYSHDVWMVELGLDVRFPPESRS